MNRRSFLWNSGGGLGGIALAWILGQEKLLAATRQGVLGGVLHHPPKAKRVVQLYMAGAASQCDTFDFKPELVKRNGQPWDPGEEVKLFQSTPGHTMASPFAWKQYGQSGKHLTEIVSPLGEVVDELAFIHSMKSKSAVHGPATFMQATGFILTGFPSMGAWVSYALGSLNDNLPTYVTLPDPRGFAPNGPKNWSAGFLPAEHQATMIRALAKEPIADLMPPVGGYITPDSDAAGREMLNRLNRRHEAAHPGDSRLDARIQAYEMAAKMQLSAPDVLNLAEEPQYLLDMYGVADVPVQIADKMSRAEEASYFGRNCLIARRLLERGVRFVQVWSGADNAFPRRNWDSHEDLRRDHDPLGWGFAVGATALIKDLRQRGMLEDTIVLWTTEFGRMPCSQGSLGRDHNPFVFTNWLAGGGIQGGVTYGESDEWSYMPADRDRPTYCYDVHATILHLLGIDHTRLTYRHNGIDRRLTDVHGTVIEDILA